MTRKEAAKIIKDYEVNGCGYCHQGGDEVEEAFDMAIKALEQTACEDWHDVPSDVMTLGQARQAVKDLRKKLAEYLRQQPCGDCISRQVVKEQMIKYGFHAPDMTITEFVENLPPVTPHPKYEDIAKAFQLGLVFGFGEKHDEMDKVIEDIKKDITPQTRWISTSERLPEVMEGTNGECSDDVLICVEDEDRDYIILTGFFGYYPNDDLYQGWWGMAEECYQLKSKYKVVAWMPLPKPYKESEV